MNSTRCAVCLCAWMTLPLISLTPRLAAEEPDAETVYKQAVKSTAVVVTPITKENAKLVPPGLREDDIPCIIGTGTLIDRERGLLVTSYRAVELSDTVPIFVEFPQYLRDGSLLADKKKYWERVKGGQSIRTKVVHKDKTRDLAVVKLDRVPPGILPLPLASSSPTVGSTVWNIGCPSEVGQAFSMTEGKVRGVGSEKFLAHGTTIDTVFEVRAKVITTTNPINRGDSGGPLYSRKGELLGVTLVPESEGKSVNRFVDASEIRALLEENKIVLKAPAETPIPKGTGSLSETKDPPPPPAAYGDDVEALYKKVVRSCVFIVTPLKGGYAMGSGSLIDVDQKLVLTNQHVVNGSDFVFVQFPIYQKDGTILTDKQQYIEKVPKGQAIRGKVLYADQSRDLAFVELEKVPVGIPALTLSKTSVSAGATTWNIGSPGAVAQVFSITEGKVRGVGIEKFMVGGGDRVFEVHAKMVSTTNPANQGDSGGPLFDKRGHQVAVTESTNTKAQLVSLFVDVSEVWAFLKEKKITVKETGDKPEPKYDSKLETPKKDNTTVVIPKKEATPPKKDDVPPAATPADERAATDKLRSAKLFANGEDNRSVYVSKLQEIVKKYPTTNAGKEAKKLLEGLK